MNRTKQHSLVCAICGEARPRSALIPAAIVRHTVADLIRAQYPAWSPDSYICHVDLARFRGQYVQTLLEAEKGELTALEQEVVQSLRETHAGKGLGDGRLGTVQTRIIRSRVSASFTSRHELRA